MEDSKDKLVIAIDQGTTSSRVIVFDRATNIHGTAKSEMQNIYPQNGWVEQDPMDYINKAHSCVKQVCDKLGPEKTKQIGAIGITNQRETSVLFDRRTGEPVHNAIVWSDSRTRDLVDDLKGDYNSRQFQKICGLPLSTYFAATKVRWLLNNNEKVKQVYESGNLAFATVDSWIIYKLTGGEVHITDSSNATRSMLVDLGTLQYSQELIEFFGFEKLILPEIKTSSEIYGYMADGPLKGVPIAGCLGDQSSALVGHLGVESGGSKATYGTGLFLLYSTGKSIVRSKKGLITTVAFHRKGESPTYALEGSIQVCGSVVGWLRNMKMLETPSQIGYLASTVDSSEGLYFVTAFSGLFAPYWEPEATGMVAGLTQDKECEHFCRAAVESFCYQTKTLTEIMGQESNTTMKRLKVDGGVSSSNEIMQIQSDILGIPVMRSSMTEPTSLGAAIAAGFAIGIWKDFADVEHAMTSRVTTTFEPKWDDKLREYRYEEWKVAVDATCSLGRKMAAVRHQYSNK